MDGDTIIIGIRIITDILTRIILFIIHIIMAGIMIHGIIRATHVITIAVITIITLL